LSVESFDLVNNATFPEHKYVKPWQPKRQFLILWWFYGSQEKFDAADKTKLTTVKNRYLLC
jgi:hypothetical protein